MDARKSDQDLWTAVVAAERRAADVRADFYRNAESRRDVLAAALQGSNWERDAALSFLEVLPEDVPVLLDQLIDNAVSPGWALAARRVIASGQTDVVISAVRQIVDARLRTADADDYRRLAELFRHLNDRPALHRLVGQAEMSDDQDIREVGEDFSLWLSESL
ncbi:hypothetical protein [Kitasatospora sp. NPDC092286]|uniref:hypothetical protein n=1 Tax=Kitasatospora sp. NPDC092286 TaxID=3364087 RepID=UPI00381086D1